MQPSMTYPFRCKVLHPPGDLIGTRQQVFEGELLLRHLGHIKGVVHARGSPGSQVFPQTAFGGILHQHVQRAWWAEASINKIKGCFCCVVYLSIVVLARRSEATMVETSANWSWFVAIYSRKKGVQKKKPGVCPPK